MNNFTARSTPWGTVQVGPYFELLPQEMQIAVLAHEEGHIFHKHALKRILWVISLCAFFNKEKYWLMCEAQELEADKYAADHGHARGLAAYLKLLTNEKKLGYPLNGERIKRLL